MANQVSRIIQKPLGLDRLGMGSQPHRYTHYNRVSCPPSWSRCRRGLALALSPEQWLRAELEGSAGPVQVPHCNRSLDLSRLRNFDFVASV